jgi:hypothetical protein
MFLVHKIGCTKKRLRATDVAAVAAASLNHNRCNQKSVHHTDCPRIQVNLLSILVGTSLNRNPMVEAKSKKMLMLRKAASRTGSKQQLNNKKNKPWQNKRVSRRGYAQKNCVCASLNF